MIVSFEDERIIDKSFIEKISDLIEIFKKRVKKKAYEDDLSFVCLPEDENNLKELEKLKGYLGINNLFFIGIGGSHLPLLAFNDFFSHKIDKRVYFFENLESKEIEDNLENLREAIEKNDFLVIVISKSGKTIETIVNFYYALKLVKEKIRNNWQEYIIVLTDKNSVLDKFASENKLLKLIFPQFQAGRFLSFSYLGLIFLYLVNLKAEEFLRGGKEINNILLTNDLENNFVIKSTFWIYQQFLNNKKLYNLFTFSSKLEGLSLWYRQLIAESLGKENKGIIPFYFLINRDLHSVYQLIREGYQEHFSNFIFLKTKSHLKIEDQFIFDISLKNKNLDEINLTIYKAIKKDFEHLNFPFFETILEDESEVEIGRFMEYKMLEIVLLGKILGVNPFDQPGIENYKNNIKKLLD